MSTAAARVLIVLAVLQMGFVRQTTTGGTPLEWRNRCPLLEIGALDPRGPSSDQIHDVLARAIDAWQADGCDELPFGISTSSGESAETVFDGRNVVVTRGADYCDGDLHDDEELCLSPNALAITTLYFVDRPGDPGDGEIVEVDMEISLKHPLADDPQPTAFDLTSVVTHEIGHVLGLAHACITEPGGRIVDPAGREVPACRAGEQDETSQATMYPWAATGEVKRRTPEPDERQAMCLLYRMHPATCEGSELAAGYTCNAGSGNGSLLLALAGLVIAISGRRRRG
jgi:uncharacterized protein (TIGR03382 family)